MRRHQGQIYWVRQLVARDTPGRQSYGSLAFAPVPVIAEDLPDDKLCIHPSKRAIAWSQGMWFRRCKSAYQTSLTTDNMFLDRHSFKSDTQGQSARRFTDGGAFKAVMDAVDSAFVENLRESL